LADWDVGDHALLVSDHLHLSWHCAYTVNQGMGFAKPMLYGTVGSLIVYVIAMYLGPETKGMQMTADLEIFEKREYP
jgi:hypothetical protein